MYFVGVFVLFDVAMVIPDTFKYLIILLSIMAPRKRSTPKTQATLVSIRPSETVVAVSKKTGAVRKPRTVKVLDQTPVPGRTKQGAKADKARTAARPGVRISKTGRRYTETRVNRSDVNRRRRL